MLTILKYVLEAVVFELFMFWLIIAIHELTKSKTRRFLEGYGFKYIRHGRFLLEIPDPIVIDFNLKSVDLMNGVSYQCKEYVEDEHMMDLFAHAMKDSGLIYSLDNELRDMLVSKTREIACQKLVVEF